MEQLGLELFDYGDEMPGEDELRTDIDPPISEDQIVASAVRWFKDNGFPYRALPAHVCLQELNRLALTPEHKLVNTNAGYHAVDSYHPHRWRASASGMRAPWDSFQDSELLERALHLQYERGIGITMFDTLKLVKGTQACSNFRPGFAMHLYRRFAKPGATVLDTSTGYGGRLFGFLASGIAGHYIGIDPNVDTHLGNLRMAHELGFYDQVTLINQPAEDVDYASVAGSCDFAFTSPPYFAKEQYSDANTQSWVRYGHSIDAWVEGFLQPMFRLQYAGLKHGCLSIVNIEDVKIKSKEYPLVRLAIRSAEQAGFTYVSEERFEMPGRFGKHELENGKRQKAFERVLVFRKV